MRAVALILIALLVPAVMPTVAAAPDDCRLAATNARACVAVPSQNAAVKTYYVYAGDSSCLAGVPPAGSNACRGEGSRAYGSLYEESNGLEGLQRETTVWNGRSFLPDRVVAY